MVTAETVSGWLSDEGLSPEPADEAPKGADWELQFKFPAESAIRLHALAISEPYERLVLISVSKVADEHREAFGKLSGSGKLEFIVSFLSAILSTSLQFTFSQEDSILHGMRLELRLFEDEINRSSVLRGSVLVSTATMLFSTMMQQKLASEEAE